MIGTRRLALVAALVGGSSFAPPQDGAPELGLKEERMTVHYTAALNEGTVVFEAESEKSLGRVLVRDPLGRRAVELASGAGQGLALSGFVVESVEFPLEELRQVYPAGAYDMSGRTVNGRRVAGHAMLKHELLDAPLVLFPDEGRANVPVNLTVSWIPDPEATGYTVVLEQGENDGLTVFVPGDQSFLEIPTGVLKPRTQGHVEVGAIHANGNVTYTEVAFTTR